MLRVSRKSSVGEHAVLHITHSLSNVAAQSCQTMAMPGLPDELVHEFVGAVGPKAVGRALGNAVSANVLERLLGRLLYAASLVEDLPEDFWRRVTPLPREKA